MINWIKSKVLDPENIKSFIVLICFGIAAFYFSYIYFSPIPSKVKIDLCTQKSEIVPFKNTSINSNLENIELLKGYYSCGKKIQKNDLIFYQHNKEKNPKWGFALIFPNDEIQLIQKKEIYLIKVNNEFLKTRNNKKYFLTSKFKALLEKGSLQSKFVVSDNNYYLFSDLEKIEIPEDFISIQREDFIGKANY